jgi:hypothetical protein
VEINHNERMILCSKRFADVLVLGNKFGEGDFCPEQQISLGLLARILSQF